MTKAKKHIFFSIIIIFITIGAYNLTEWSYGGGSGFCCGSASRPSIKYLDYYLAGIGALGVLILIVGNIIIVFRGKRR